MKRPKYDFSNPQKFIEKLKEKGLDDETILMIQEDMNYALQNDPVYDCHSCGRLSGNIQVELNGEEIYACPDRIIYAYREGKPYGLCSYCFEDKSFADFDEDEIAYFTESFTESSKE